jgi:hypothetical protein
MAIGDFPKRGILVRDFDFHPFIPTGPSGRSFF